MNNTLTVLKKKGLINSNISYSEIANAFISKGYTSIAGNTYFNSIRVAEGILIKEDVGQGYAHTFLNGIKIYSIRDKTLIADKRFNNVRYNQSRMKSETKKLLLNMLEESAKAEGYIFNIKDSETIIENILNKALEENQNDFIKKQTSKYLIAS
tara:strand:- start:4602 stop:5063 length:462 start_codon:yes stop_codon:yes gene_type:complete